MSPKNKYLRNGNYFAIIAFCLTFYITVDRKLQGGMVGAP